MEGESVEGERVGNSDSTPLSAFRGHLLVFGTLIFLRDMDAVVTDLVFFSAQNFLTQARMHDVVGCVFQW